jgi:DNA-binding NarL/FixJ family response regulator
MNTTSIKVALADDHAILRKGLVNIMNGFDNIEVIADAGNGEELISQLKAISELPDVLVLDVNMPVMDGYATAAAVRENWPSIKILVLSMYDSEENIIRMLRSGANGYVLKDISPEDLKAAIYHLKTNAFYYSDVVTGRLLYMAQNGEKEQVELTDRETEFLQLSCSDLTYKEIADKMGVSARTVDGYRDNLFRKLSVASRVGLAIYAIKTGLVKI